MLELKRSDIGVGSIVIDDRGVTRQGPTHGDTIGWDEIRDYRLTIEVQPLNDLLTNGVPVLGELLMLADVVRGYRGESNVKLGIDLHGPGKHVGFNWRFVDVELGIAHVLQRIGKRLVDQAREQLAATGVAQFGPIELLSDEVRWGKKVIERDAVESIELFDSSPAELRVMARGKALPYAHAPTAEIPNLCGLLQIASGLGYRVKGAGLLEAFRPGLPRAAADA
jgi:hypothetical protein